MLKGSRSRGADAHGPLAEPADRKDLHAPIADDARRSNPGAGAAGGVIHVRAYRRTLNGRVIQVQAYDRSASWANRANADFRKRIGEAEGNFDVSGARYDKKNEDTGALGLYQLLPGTLAGIGWRNRNGTWTDKARAHGVISDETFLSNPHAQEDAMDEVLRQYEREARAYRLYGRLGTTIQGRRGPIMVSEAGLMAAIHRGGAEGTRRYFQAVDRAEGISINARLDKKQVEIETRLRQFQRARYRQIGP